MKRTSLLAAFAVAVAIVAGCNKQQSSGGMEGDTNAVPATNDSSASSTVSNAWQSTKTASSNAWEDTKAASSNAWENTKEFFSSGSSTNGVSTNFFAYNYSQKDEFVADARTDLDKLDQWISHLSDKVASASDADKAGLQQQLQDLKAKRADLDQKYDKVRDATQDDWDNAKAAFETSFTNVADAIRSAWHSLSGTSGTSGATNSY